MTSDHRVAGSSPAGCKPSATTTYADDKGLMNHLLGNFLDTFSNTFAAAKVFRSHLRTAFPGCHQSLSRSFKNSFTPSNFFTSAKLIACVASLASLSTRPVFFDASHKSRMARAQTAGLEARNIDDPPAW
jgi:hypothetical protein